MRGRNKTNAKARTVLVGKANFHVHLQAAGAQQRLINELLAVRHTNDQNVVERLHTVQLGQQLVHHCVADSGAVAARPALLANGVDLVKNDDVLPRQSSAAATNTHPHATYQRRLVATLLVLELGVGKQLANVLF